MYAIPAPSSATDSRTDTSEKLGVSLFGLVSCTARIVNLLYDQQ
jgi:hypothetical protein